MGYIVVGGEWFEPQFCNFPFSEIPFCALLVYFFLFLSFAWDFLLIYVACVSVCFQDRVLVCLSVGQGLVYADASLFLYVVVFVTRAYLLFCACSGSICIHLSTLFMSLSVALTHLQFSELSPFSCVSPRSDLYMSSAGHCLTACSSEDSQSLWSLLRSFAGLPQSSPSILHPLHVCFSFSVASASDFLCVSPNWSSVSVICRSDSEVHTRASCLHHPHCVSIEVQCLLSVLDDAPLFCSASLHACVCSVSGTSLSVDTH